MILSTKLFSCYSQSIHLFVPGRVCLFGEHSDWCAMFGEKGLALVGATEIGISSTIERVQDGKKSFIFKSNSHEQTMPLDCQKLGASAKKNSDFFAYVNGAASVFLHKYPQKTTDSIKIICANSTLPAKKGLSSSAAVCVLVVRALSMLLLNKTLSPYEEMDIAYHGERLTPSLCGRLDQTCAFLKPGEIALVEFHPHLENNDISVIVKDILSLQNPLHILIVSLKGKKDTIKILSALQHAARENISCIRELFGQWNANSIMDALDFLKTGNVQGLGILATKTQSLFDQHALPLCPTELTAPALHALINDPIVINLSTGGKSIGAGGDGCALLFCETQQKQTDLFEYITSNLNLEAWSMEIC